MPLSPTLRQSAFVFIAASLAITAARLVRGHALAAALVEGALWASVSTIIFGAWDWRRRRRGEYCAVCDVHPPGPPGR